MLMGWVWIVAFWGFVFWAVYVLVTRVGRPDRSSHPPTSEPTALEILERRYARGEVGHEEFEAMRRRLSSAGAVDTAPASTGRDAARAAP
jgi:putative membrane protein